MDPGSIILVVVAGIGAISAYASQRAASRASTLNTTTVSRVDMEKDAYNRARAFDMATITRQDGEILNLQAQIRKANLKIRDLEKENRILQQRVDHLEENERRHD